MHGKDKYKDVREVHFFSYLSKINTNTMMSPRKMHLFFFAYLRKINTQTMMSPRKMHL